MFGCVGSHGEAFASSIVAPCRSATCLPHLHPLAKPPLYGYIIGIATAKEMGVSGEGTSAFEMVLPPTGVGGTTAVRGSAP